MTAIRRKYAKILDEKLKDLEDLDIPCEDANCRCNYQYYVVRVRNDTEKHIFDDMFRKGIHLMQEDVWDCTSYEFAKEYYRECPVASSHTPGLIRIQNNSLLRPETISRIGDEFRASVLKESNHV
jgi:dTDP-4-amino-4,6-dideoxygalactose transaminase